MKSNRLPLLLCFCLLLTAAAGCSPSTMHSSSTREAVSISEQTRDGLCLATVTVPESANGETQTQRRAGVSCASVKAVQSALAAQAKQGL